MSGVGVEADMPRTGTRAHTAVFDRNLRRTITAVTVGHRHAEIVPWTRPSIRRPVVAATAKNAPQAILGPQTPSGDRCPRASHVTPRRPFLARERAQGFRDLHPGF
jgi:hypothetical protein